MATENEQLLEEQARLREKEDRKFMRQALTQAKKAAAIDEVPLAVLSFVMEKSLPEAITEET